MNFVHEDNGQIRVADIGDDIVYDHETGRYVWGKVYGEGSFNNRPRGEKVS